MKLTTRQLSKRTWPDFERLFSQGNGWDFCWCMAYHRERPLPLERSSRTRAACAEQNRHDHKQLVDARRSHGILVYSDRQPVGWCQYGPRDELPRIDSHRNYPAQSDEPNLWRITCFVVVTAFRGRGVAAVALTAALEAIRDLGGGVVEAYPSTPVSRRSTSLYGGTVSMFRRAGFEPVATLSGSRLVMRKNIPSGLGAAPENGSTRR